MLALLATDGDNQLQCIKLYSLQLVAYEKTDARRDSIHSRIISEK